MLLRVGKLKLKKFVFVVLIVLFLVPSAAQARDPQEALSSRTGGAVYLTLRLEDLGGMLRTIFSPGNIETLTSFMKPEEAQGVRLVGSIASQLPVRSVSFIAGTTADKTPFLQIAASMPKELQPKLDLVAAGKATPEDLVTLVLGNGGLLLAAAVPPLKVQQGEKGPYYLIDNEVAISAKDDLLLMTLSSKDMQDSLNALEDGKNRLVLNRRFNSPDYYYLHVDVGMIAELAAQGNQEELAKEVDLKALQAMFRAPLDLEVGFDSKPGSLLVSCAVNILEAFTGADRFKDMKPIPGGGMFLAGEGRALLGLAGATSFNAADLKAYPEAAKIWARIVKETSKRGIAETDIVNMLNGSFSFVAGSHATILGKPTPGAYLALSGQKGAAAKILDKILANEDFTKAVSVSPVKIDGWDRLFRVDPTLIPAPVLFGVKGDTLFVGVVDPDSLTKTPDLSPEAAKLLKNDLFAGGFVDVAGIWDYVKNQAGDKNSHIGTILATAPADLVSIVNNILGAELPVSFLKLWAPELETSFAELTVVDVPQEKRLLPRLIAAANAINSEGMSSGDEEESPLSVLLSTKGTIEAKIAQDPKTDLEELEDEFSDVVYFMETGAGDLYIGMPVAGDSEKLELIEQARKFDLTGSAGPTLSPDGNAYDGQEIVWIKIVR